MSAIFACALGTEALTKYQCVGVFMYGIGMTFILEITSGKVQSSINTKDEVIGLIQVSASVVLRCVKLILLQYLLREKLISNELLLALGITVTNVSVFIRYRRDINFRRDVLEDKVILKALLIQAICVGLGNTLHGRAINLIGEVPVSIICSFTLVLQIIILHKKKMENISKNIVAGTITVLASILIFMIK